MTENQQGKTRQGLHTPYDTEILRVGGMRGHETSRAQRNLTRSLLHMLSTYEAMPHPTEPEKAVYWDVKNFNFNDTVDISNTHETLREAAAFLYMAKPTFENVVTAVSLLTAYTTGDESLHGKPLVFADPKAKWGPTLKLIQDLHEKGMIKQDPKDLYERVTDLEFLTDPMVERASKVTLERIVENADRQNYMTSTILPIARDAMKIAEAFERQKEKIRGFEVEFEETHPNKHYVKAYQDTPAPDYNVGVMLSASSKNPEHLVQAYKTGRQLANEDIGTVSGVGAVGPMYALIRGAKNLEYVREELDINIQPEKEGKAGWTGGSTVKRFATLEGFVPREELDQFEPAEHIYARIENFLHTSDSFIINSGGLGTLQEALFMIQLKDMNADIMKDKPIVIVNERGFWNSLIEVLKHFDVEKHVTVVNSVEEAIDVVKADRDQIRQKTGGITTERDTLDKHEETWEALEAELENRYANFIPRRSSFADEEIRRKEENAEERQKGI